MTDTPPEPPSDEPSVETFRADLPRSKRKPPATRATWVRRILIGLAALLVVAIVAAGLAGLTGYLYIRQHYLQDVPEIPAREQLYAFNRAPGIKFFDRTGALIASRGPNFGDRVTLGRLPAYVPRAFLAAEDKRFYAHGPVDAVGVARAAWVNWRAGRVVQGGSTLSQQLAKGLFLTPDQTLKRKVQEAVLALRLERMLSKDEVLELYLNRTYFGANAFGVDGAARAYFGKPASKLTLSEAALLAALPKAPSRMALTHNMSAALDRQHRILAIMEEEGWVSPQQVAEALRSPPKLSEDAFKDDGDMGYVLDYATSEVLKLVGPASPDLMVRLTVDPRLQAAGGEALRRVLRTDGARAGATQGALVAMSADGAIRTMVGGVDYGASVFNRAVQARRQPGSSFKPFVYAAALEHGVLPSDVRVDEPVRIGTWAPSNYGGGYRGAVTVDTALSQSINTVAVKLAQEAGPDSIADVAHRFGLGSIPASPNLSIALGSYEVPLAEMVAGYQVFQNQGNRVTPYIVDEIQTADGQPLYRHATSSPIPVYDLVHDSMMVRMMEHVIQGGTGTRAALDRPAAGKTGTSQNFRDAWFLGFTPDFVAGVWVGNDDERPMNRVTGGVLPAEIWRRFMMVAHDGLPVRDFDWLAPEPVPEGVEGDTGDGYGDSGDPYAPEPAPDPRNNFYDGLSRDFDAPPESSERYSEGRRPPPQDSEEDVPPPPDR